MAEQPVPAHRRPRQPVGRRRGRVLGPGPGGRRRRRPSSTSGCGFIELAAPDLDTAVDRLVERGAASVVAVPLVLLGAGHMKDDGPAALHRGRHRHPAVRFAYARHLGIHPLVLAVAEDRIRAAVGDARPGRDRGRPGQPGLVRPRRQRRPLQGRPAPVGLPGPGHGGAGVRLARRAERPRRPRALPPAGRDHGSSSSPTSCSPASSSTASATRWPTWAAAHPEVDARPGPHLGRRPPHRRARPRALPRGARRRRPHELRPVRLPARPAGLRAQAPHTTRRR